MPTNRVRGTEPAADRPQVAVRSGVLLTVAMAVVVLEALALVVVAGWWLVQVLTVGSRNLAVGLFVAVFALGVAAALVAAVRSVRGGGRGGRSPIVAWQLLQGATSVAVLQVARGQVAAVALTALVVAAVVLVLLLTTTPTGPRPTAEAPPGG